MVAKKKKTNFWRELKRLEIYISSNFFPSSSGRGIQITSRAERSSSAKTQSGTRSSVCRRPCFKDDSRLQKKRGEGGRMSKANNGATLHCSRRREPRSHQEFNSLHVEPNPRKRPIRPADLNEAAGPVGVSDPLTSRPQFCPESTGNKT